jgi:hypothetical protein
MRFDISANRLVSRRVEECTVGDVRRFASVLLTCLAFAAFLLICLAVALARTVSAATTISSPQSTIASVQASSQVAASNLIPGAKGLHVKNAQGRSKPQ